MRAMRWALAVLVALYALMSAMPAAFTVLHKLRLLRLPEMVRTHGALMDAMSWPQVALWWLVVGLFLAVAWRLAFVRGQARLLFLGAFVLDVMGWLWMQGPAYDATFPPGQRQSDLAIIAVMAVVGLLVAWVERRRPTRRAAAPGGARATPSP